MTITALRSSLEAARSALATALAVAVDNEQPTGNELGIVPDDELLRVMNEAAAVRRLVDASAALLAAEVARRSSRHLGHSGLAQRLGHRTAEELVRVTTGSSRHDARIAVRAGALLGGQAADPGGPAGSADPGAAADPATPASCPSWATEAAARVARGELSVAALEAIVAGLGDVNDMVSADSLIAALESLVNHTPALDVDRLHAHARQLRNELDAASAVRREQRLRDERSLRLSRGRDGMTRAVSMLDPESAAVVTDLYDRATSPRREGPTFLANRDAALIERINADERTPEQYASDAFLDLLRAGADADGSALLGSGAPSVRVIVTAADFQDGEGLARIEGHTEPLSLPSAQRMMCAGTQIPILVSSTGQPLDVGRSQRLFTARQRIALAARDGGCRWRGCERPPSWCEAHHVEPWSAAHGRTDVADGVLLCRHHHLLVHNNGWRIERRRGSDGRDDYVAIAPPSHDAPHEVLSLPAKLTVLTRALPRRDAA